MNVATKLVGFAAGVAVVFGGAAGVGAVVGPLGDGASASSESMAEHGPDAEDAHDSGSGADHGSKHAGGDSGELPGGLMISQGGYELDLAEATLPAESDAPLRFRILRHDGEPVTEYAEEHGKALHLIVVRRDMVGYQHVHPTLGSDGVWSADVDLSAAGEYRTFADFVPTGGEGLTLGADISAAGTYEPRTLPDPARSTQVGDYEVELDGNLVPGESSALTLTVSKNGEPVTDLQPYLEAYGHLVALRDGDLAYLHVHPDGSPADGSTKPGPQIRFLAEAPSTGSYRLFLDFKHDGEVRTAQFTMNAGSASSARSAGNAVPGGHGESDHGHD